MLLPWLTWKLVRRVVTFLVVAALAYYLVTVFQVWRAAESDDARHSQALIVLGAAQYNGQPSPVYRARLDHAADLYRRGVAPVVVVTGGKEAGDRFTEAGAGADYLHTKGVPDAAILRETTGRSSWESLAASARFLQSRGIRRVVLVSDPFHSLRIRLIASELGFDAVTSPTRTSPIGGFDEWKRYFGEALRVAVGRIFGFGRLARASAAAAAVTGVSVGARASGVAILGGPSGVV